MDYTNKSILFAKKLQQALNYIFIDQTNNTFTITLYGIPPFIFTIPQGEYTPELLCDEINQLIQLSDPIISGIQISYQAGNFCIYSNCIYFEINWNTHELADYLGIYIKFINMKILII